MNMMRILTSLGPVDLKNIRRDSLLAWILVLPIILALFFRLAIPPLTIWAQERFAIDCTPYYPLLLSTFILLAPGMAGLVTGFLLLDERDDRTLTALLVTPMPLNGYLFYRISFPIVIGFITTFIGYPLIGLIPIAPLDLVIIALLGALSGPLVALFLAAFAENKVAGLTMVKMLNGITLLPLVAYFVQSDLQVLAGVIPTYWPLKIFWLAAAGQSYWGYVVAGFVINGLALWLFMRRFYTILHR
jgi:fluoroquinolone transport system permease protein